jgi:multiple sugar transport system permease protein
MKIASLPKMRLKLSTQDELTGWLFALPWILGFILFTAGPMLWSALMSFTNYDMFKWQWTGLANFRRMFLVDDLVLRSLGVTTTYALMSVPLHLTFGFSLALLLNQKIKGLSIWRTIFYLPSVISGVAVIIMWILILSPEFGLINSILAYVGIKGPNWLGSPQTALPSLVMMSLWGVGGSMLIYLGGLQGIPTELYDAAKVDGCNDAQSFWNVTIPMMSPVIFFNLVMGIIGALQTFDTAFIATKGGPAFSTYFYMLHLFTNAFEMLRMGYASALAWILFIYIMILTMLVFRFGSTWVFYEEAFKKEKKSKISKNA